MALALFIFPATRLQASLDVHLLILFEVRFADFSEIAPGHHVEPFVFFESVAFGTGPPAARDHTKTRHWTAAWCIAHFRIAAQVADYHDLVKTPAHTILLDPLHFDPRPLRPLTSQVSGPLLLFFADEQMTNDLF